MCFSQLTLQAAKPSTKPVLVHSATCNTNCKTLSTDYRGEEGSAGGVSTTLSPFINLLADSLAFYRPVKKWIELTGRVGETVPVVNYENCAPAKGRGLQNAPRGEKVGRRV